MQFEQGINFLKKEKPVSFPDFCPVYPKDLTLKVHAWYRRHDII